MRILIVDHGSATSAAFASLLRSWNHQVRTATAGWDAVQTAREMGPDVVLFDATRFTTLAGEYVMQLRRESEKRQRGIVALTASADRLDRVRAYEAGCDAHLTKPVEEEAFKAVIARFQQHVGSGATGRAGHADHDSPSLLPSAGLPTSAQ